MKLYASQEACNCKVLLALINNIYLTELLLQQVLEKKKSDWQSQIILGNMKLNLGVLTCYGTYSETCAAGQENLNREVELAWWNREVVSLQGQSDQTGFTVGPILCIATISLCIIKYNLSLCLRIVRHYTSTKDIHTDTHTTISKHMFNIP